MGGEYGPSFSNGQPNYFSASSLTTADPNSYAGCLRAYWYKYVDGRREEETEAMRRGTNELHKPIEHYYKTGEKLLGRLPSSGAAFMPERGADLLVEIEICHPPGVPMPPELPAITLPPGVKDTRRRFDLSLAPLKLAGVPLVGKIDLAHERGFYLDSEGELRQEPRPNTAEVKDWKSTSSFGYAKTPDKLAVNVQLDVYDAWVRTIAPWIENVRRSHVYFLTKGKPDAKKFTVLLDAEQSARRREYVDSLARQVVDVARETDPNKVPGNVKSCDCYKKGCPHREICSVGKRDSLSSYFGVRGEAAVTEKVIDAMSLIKNLNPGVVAAGVPAVAPAVVPFAGPSGIGALLGLGTAPPSTVAGLAAEEAARAAAPQALAPSVIAALAAISEARIAGFGNAPLVGVAAQADAINAGQGVPDDYTIAGTGKLGGAPPIDTLDKLVEHGAQLRQYFDSMKPAQPATVVAPVPAPVVVPAPIPVAAAPGVAAVLSPQTPPSNPAIAALPVPGFVLPGAPVVTQNTTGAVVVPVPVAAPITSASLAATHVEAPAPAKKRGRPAKVKPPEGTTGEDGETFALFADCTPTCEHESLQPYVDAWHDALISYYQVDPPDIRAGADKPLGFGGWKGVLAATVRKVIADGRLPRACYTIDTHGNEFNSIVVSAMIASKALDFVAMGH